MNPLQWLPLDASALDAALRSARQTHPGMGVLALIVHERFCTDGVWLLRLDAGLRACLVDRLDHEDGAQRLVDALQALLPTGGDGQPTLALFFDAMIGHIGSLLDEVYLQLADRVRYTGANAGSETFAPMPCLFDTERCIGQGALGVLLPSASAPRLDHGYPIPTEALLATSTEGNCITSIDWQPAFEVYRELIAAHYGVHLDHDNFYALACHFPFGVLQADGSVIVRIPVAVREDGALFCVGEVPANRMLVVLRAPEAAGNPCVERLAPTRAAPHTDTLLFYCAGRRMHMAEGAVDELTRLQAAGSGTLGGALSLGEIGSLQSAGYPMFHNAALVALPVPQT
jgi:hypothetical protein